MFSLRVAPMNTDDAESEIVRRIREHGRITFAEFMELALFWPKGGYYTNPDNVGAEGDFYTAPGAHPAFGALLCVQAFQMWQLLGRPSTFWLVEMGAGSGLLCHDIVGYATHISPGFANSLRYLCLDRNPPPGVESLLTGEARGMVERVAAQNVPLRGVDAGCFLSNELVDSLPVHRVTIDGGGLKEIFVTLKEGKLAEVLDSPSTPALEERLDSLGISLTEGFSTEINLAMESWMKEVSSALERGFLLTIDYGHPATELYSPGRRRGTLTCFYKHTQTDNPYLRIGRQDITTHVDFTSMVELGKTHGLETLSLNTQKEFLHSLGLGRFMARLPTSGLRQREVEANRLGMLDIVRPGGMGEFKVLVQGKGVESPSLWGYEPSRELEEVLDRLPLPLLTPLHVPLLEGRYPHLAFEWEEMLS